MNKSNKRPVFLNLTQIRFPVTAVVSVIHRLSGVLLCLFIPVLIYLFGLSIKDEAGYSLVASLLSGLTGHLIVVLLAWALAHHFLAGIRFLLIDLDIGISKFAAVNSAWIVNIGAVGVAALILGLMI